MRVCVVHILISVLCVCGRTYTCVHVTVEAQGMSLLIALGIYILRQSLSLKLVRLARLFGQ